MNIRVKKKLKSKILLLIISLTHFRFMNTKHPENDLKGLNIYIHDSSRYIR